MKFVRIRPFNKARGQLVRRYVYGGVRFEATHGWYEVDDEIADYLKTVLTHPQNPDSKPVFDVADKEGAMDIERGEYEAANPERKISEAVAGRQKVTVDDIDGDAKAKAGVPSADGEDKPKEKASSPAGKKEKPAKGGEKSGASEPPADPKATGSGKSKP